MVYPELKAIAHRQLKSERQGHTLNTTAVVHEAYLRLGLDRIAWNDRVHFFAVAARAMRRVLIDYGVARRTDKRGRDPVRVTLDRHAVAPEHRVEDLLALDKALGDLERHYARQVRVVECHVFAGMNLDETALALGVSPATVSRDWALARAWLNRTLSRSSEI
jgi:RNA polymerase sigma factor (TIGR02999 family)